MELTTLTARAAHDLGLAAWFGGSLMGAVGLNQSASPTAGQKRAAAVASSGWATWTPVNLAAIAAHVAGGAVLTKANAGRLAGQRGVAVTSAVKTAVTAGALGATAYARILGQRVIANADQRAEGGTEPAPETDEPVAAAQRQLAVLQWVIPALTGTLIVLTAVMGEQQRPREVFAGIAQRLGLA